MNTSMMGVSIAVEGMKTSCGATLIASQHTDTIEAGSVSSAAHSATQGAANEAATPVAVGLAAAVLAASANRNAAGADKGKFDEQLRVLDEKGHPIANMPYHIVDESGKSYKGLTDADGRCERVHTANAQSLNILTGAPALEKW